VIVECPACHTRYRVHDVAALTENTLFECSQDSCRHVFPCAPELLKSGQPEEPEDSVSPVDPRREDGTPDDAPPEEPFPPLHPTSATAPLRTKVTTPSFAPVQPATRERLDSFTEEEDFSLLEEEDPPFPPVADRSQEEIEAAAEESVPYRKQVHSATEPTGSPKVLFALLGVLVLGYAGLSAYGRTHIEGTEAVLARLPLVGPRFIASQFSTRHIVLSDLTSIAAVTKDSKQVLAVSGKATNTAPVPASTIQIEGTLYDAAGKVLSQRQTFCGTETAMETLPSLTTREIGILQNLAPPKQFTVAGGQSISFLIVFVNPPAAVSELGSRVLTVQFKASD
jgi:uncharacterized protein DUF3426